MGAKQSTGNPSANGRTRAYSGSDLPSSTSSSNDTSRTAALAMRYSHYGPSTHGASGAAAAHHLGQRTRSMGGGGGGSGPRAQALNQAGLNIPNSSGTYSSQESDNGTPEENTGELDRSSGGHGAPRLLIGSLPAHLSPHMFGGFKCPVCSKFVPSDEMDLHLVMCLTKPRITYNEDVLTKDAGECAICLEELVQGDTIARLPCLCIYHKGCINECASLLFAQVFYFPVESDLH
ncbi:E3 ubiquitin-protein ligase znrf2-like isoform X1 [Acipenser oxyrinchus oxyrinchus]|uniref:RING-type E3 ubiquitin transferase n=1 Tax=Acipenser oxyrinchus oxyrinchus TaxID=40147 RepID=A0AAD8GFV4_ACIOX|nr:E3 ubiquitin-protein ligase znrf2-like isoform X1 [Acipenser oxyrinchus oxyrinchus]